MRSRNAVIREIGAKAPYGLQKGEPSLALGGRGSALVRIELGDDAGRIALELVGGDDAEASLGAEVDDGDHWGLRKAVGVAVPGGEVGRYGVRLLRERG